MDKNTGNKTGNDNGKMEQDKPSNSDLSIKIDNILNTEVTPVHKQRNNDINNLTFHVSFPMHSKDKKYYICQIFMEDHFYFKVNFLPLCLECLHNSNLIRLVYFDEKKNFYFFYFLIFIYFSIYRVHTGCQIFI